MNKSLGTTLTGVLLILIGFAPIPFSNSIKTMGLYAFSGAITNWLAIHMLFEKVPFLYGSGIVTERFEEFKVGIKELVMNQFFTEENLKKFLSGGSTSLINIEEEALIGSIDFDKIFNKLKLAILESQFGGMLNMFGGEQALEPLKPQFEQKFKEIIIELLEDEKFLASFTSKASSNSSLLENVSNIVELRLEELTPGMVKEIIQGMIQKHLGWLVVWGGVFGALIGLISSVLL